jgi:hypothetical protein
LAYRLKKYFTVLLFMILIMNRWIQERRIWSVVSRRRETDTCQHRLLYANSSQDRDAEFGASPVWVVCHLACPRGPTEVKLVPQ